MISTSLISETEYCYEKIAIKSKVRKNNKHALMHFDFKLQILDSTVLKNTFNNT